MLCSLRGAARGAAGKGSFVPFHGTRDVESSCRGVNRGLLPSLSLTGLPAGEARPGLRGSLLRLSPQYTGNPALQKILMNRNSYEKEFFAQYADLFTATQNALEANRKERRRPTCRVLRRTGVLRQTERLRRWANSFQGGYFHFEREIQDRPRARSSAPPNPP